MSRRYGRLLALGVSTVLTLGLAVIVAAPPSQAAGQHHAVHTKSHPARSRHPVAHSSAAPASRGVHPDALPYSVNLGYADNVRANPVNFPTPWNGSPNVVFEGCTGSCELDGGAVQVVNTSTHAVKVQSITITYDTCLYDIWPTNVNIPKGDSMIIDQLVSGATSGCVPETGTMDSSDIGPGGVSWAGNCNQSGVIPQIAVKVAGVTTTFADTGQVLNTGGVDGADCNPLTSNESEQWTPVGSSICPGSTLTLTPATAQKQPSASVNMTATFQNSCGDPLSGVDVDFDVTSGPDAGTTGTSTTNNAGKATFTVANNGTQGIDFVTASIDNYVGTITSPTSYLYFEQASLTLTPNSGVPGDTINYVGHNFAANEPVELHENSPGGPLLASTTANNSGTVSGTFVVPVPTGAAFTEVVAVGLTSGRQGWSLFSQACSDDWVSPVSGDWNTPSDWSTGSVPSASDVACIILPGTYTVQMNQSHTVAGLLLGTSSGTGTQTLVLNGRNLTFTMNGASTVLSTGVFSLTSVDGGTDTINGSGTLVNDGVVKTVNANGTQRYLRMNIVNDASGLFQVGNFDTRLDQNFSLTNNGTLKVLSGGGLGISTGTFVQSGGSVSVLGTGSLGFGNETITASGGSFTGSATVTNSTMTDSGMTGGTLYFRCSNTLSGTIASGQTVDVRADNCGGSQLNLSGTVTNNGTVKMESLSGGGSAVLNGGTLTNNGTLTTTQGSGGTRYLRSDIVNAAGATTSVNAYDTRMDSGNTFTNNGALTIGSSGDLQFFSSTLTVNGSETMSVPTPGSLYLQNSTFNDNGGTLTGTAYFNNSTLNEAGGSGGSFVVECQNNLSGTIAASRSIEVQGNGCGNANLNLLGTVVNNGTVTMTSTNGNSSYLNNNSFTNNGTFSTVQGNGGTRYLRSDFVNAAGATATINAYDTRMDQGNTFTNNGSLTVGSTGDLQFYGSTFTTTGTISDPVVGSFYLQNSTYNDNGGTITGTAYLNNSTLNEAGGSGGTLVLECSDTLTGTIAAGQTVEVQGNGCGSASTNLSGTVVNNGTLNMTSTNGNYSLISGGPFTNNGAFNTVQGNGGTRYVRVDVTNSAGATATVGDFDTRQDNGNTFTNSGTVSVPAGGGYSINTGGLVDLAGSTLSVDPAGSMFVNNATLTSGGGTASGTVTLQNSTLSDSGGTGGTYLMQCTDSLTGTVQSGQTVDAQGNGCGSATLNVDAAGVTNFGTLVLDSTNGNYVLLQGGTLTNRGTVNVSGTGGGTRYLRVAIVNGSGASFTVSASDTRQDSSTTFTNTANGKLTIQDGATLSLNSGSSFVQSSASATFTATVDAGTNQGYGITGGSESLAGKLRIITVGSPSGGTPYTIIGSGSVTGTFASVSPPTYGVNYTATTVTVSLPA